MGLSILFEYLFRCHLVFVTLVFSIFFGSALGSSRGRTARPKHRRPLRPARAVRLPHTIVLSISNIIDPISSFHYLYFLHTCLWPALAAPPSYLILLFGIENICIQFYTILSLFYFISSQLV